MANLNDIVELAEAFETQAVYLVTDRCVAVRNRHSSCKKCVEACHVEAISVGKNQVIIDNAACVSCGACAVACPTEALIPLAPLDQELAFEITQATLATQGMAVFTCARMEAKHIADPDKCAVVPCLARMEESLLIDLVAQGVQSIVLVDGNCKTCKYHACEEGFERVASTVNDLIKAQGGTVTVRRASEFPESVLSADISKSYAASRRGFFKQTGASMKSAGRKAAEKALMAALNEEKKELTLREQLGIRDGRLPIFHPERHLKVLDAMDQIGTSQIPEIETRLFGSVEIDPEVCTTCMMCTVFCPTGALMKSDEAPTVCTNGAKADACLEFSLADCVQCNLCVDACPKKCLSVNPCVSTEELFDFEPRIINLPKQPERFGFARI